MASDWEGLSIAPGDDMFTASPTWERLDTQAGLRVSQIDIERGKEDEFSTNDTGTMTVSVRDTGGIIDPTNAGGAYYGSLLGKPIAFGVRNPVTDEWFPRFRGTIDSITGDLEKSQTKQDIQIHCVDLFDYFANIQMLPNGVWGNPGTIPAASAGFVWWEDTAGTVDDRLNQALTQAGIGAGLRRIFTGNVSLRESVYSPGEALMTVLMDCANAEFPSVSNLFVDKSGFVAFHGRNARFDPDSVAAQPGSTWDFNRWKAGDGAAIALDSTRAQVRPPFGWDYSRKMVRNSAMAYPQGITASDRAGQVVEDLVSQANGIKTWSAENLVILAGVTTGNTANEECLLFCQYIIDNYAQPRVRVENVTLRSLHPTDSRAAATWALMTRVDISDIVDLAIGHPGGGGFAEEGYVEGIRETYRPLGGDLDTGYPDVTQELSLSPQAYWTTNPFPS